MIVSPFYTGCVFAGQRAVYVEKIAKGLLKPLFSVGGSVAIVIRYFFVQLHILLSWSSLLLLLLCVMVAMVH